MGLQDLTQLNVPDEADEDGQQATSFFHWFTEPADEPATEDEVAETIREQIWPNPLQLYMGETVRAPVVASWSETKRSPALLSHSGPVLKNWQPPGRSLPFWHVQSDKDSLPCWKRWNCQGADTVTMTYPDKFLWAMGPALAGWVHPHCWMPAVL